MQHFLRAIFSLLFLLTPLSSFAEGVKANVSQREVSLNGTFTVTFSVGEKTENPDFSALANDFELLSVNHAQTVNIVNGTINKEFQWQLLLMAKHEGDLSIPSIKFGAVSSDPIGIVVKPASAPSSNDDLFMETEITPAKEVFVHSPFLYKLKIYTRNRFAEARLGEFKTSDPDAIIEPLGKDKEYELQHPNGRRYLVIERCYVVFPSHAGPLKIFPVLFDAALMVGGHGFFNVQAERVRVVTEMKELTVKPIPPPFTRRDWLAATKVELSEEWSSSPQNMQVGEPITWTVAIKVKGTLPSHIPDLALSFPEGIKHYTDKAEIIPSTDQSSPLEGTKQIKMALIPSKSGTFTLPEVRLAWWNLTSDKKEESILQARSFSVSGGEVAIAAPSLIEPQSERPLAAFPSFMIGIMGGALVVALAAFIFLMRKPPTTNEKKDSFSSLKSALKEACKKNDPKSAEKAFLSVMAAFLNPERQICLLKVLEVVESPLKESVEELQKALYGKDQNWEGKNLWTAFLTFKPKKNFSEKSNKEALKSLYPKF